MTPDEIRQDREAGTPETHEPDYKAAMLYHSDRADAYMSERDALTAENAALKERVAELEDIITMLAKFDARNSIVHLREIARATLEKSRE